MTSIPIRTALLVALTATLSSCDLPRNDIEKAVKERSKEEKRAKALNDLQVVRFEKDFDENRFFASAKSGRSMLLDRRTGCVYDDVQSLSPILKSDGAPDCDYGPDKIVETGRKHDEERMKVVEEQDDETVP